MIALTEYAAQENYPARRLPALPGRHAGHGVLSAGAVRRRQRPTQPLTHAADRHRVEAPSTSASLGPRLDALYRDFNQADAIADPVNLVRRFAVAADREVAGFCAAALAFGRVASVNASIEPCSR